MNGADPAVSDRLADICCASRTIYALEDCRQAFQTADSAAHAMSVGPNVTRQRTNVAAELAPRMPLESTGNQPDYLGGACPVGSPLRNVPSAP